MGDENLRTVYQQYWLHARHVELETWLFTSIYAVIMTAIFGAVGANIPSQIQLMITFFGAILSLLGFSIIYTLRIPFLKFALMSEIIAINDFKIKDEYRRFFPKGGKVFPKDKWFDIHDVLAIFYSVLTGILFYLFLNLLLKNLLWFLIPSVVVSLGLIGMHFLYIRPKKYIKEISEELEKYLEDKKVS